MTKHYYFNNSNSCICNTFSPESTTKIIDEVNCYKCKDILSRQVGNKFYDKRLKDEQRLNDLENTRREIKVKIEKKKNDEQIQLKIRELEDKKIKIMALYKNRAVQKLYLEDIRYQNIIEEINKLKNDS
jgi:hypothetical protein